MKKNGFTLLEMLVVSLIIGILASIAFPQYQLAVERSRAAEGITILRSLRDAQFNYFLTHGKYSSNINDLDLSFQGEDAEYSGVARKESPNFSYAVKNTESELAVAARKPLIKDYVLKVQQRQVICRVYSEFGRKVCQSFGGDRVVDMGGSGFEAYEVK